MCSASDLLQVAGETAGIPNPIPIPARLRGRTRARHAERPRYLQELNLIIFKAGAARDPAAAPVEPPIPLLGDLPVSRPTTGDRHPLPAIDTGIDEHMHAIANQPDGLRGEHPNRLLLPPAPGHPWRTRFSPGQKRSCWRVPWPALRRALFTGNQRRRRQPVQEPGSASRLQAQGGGTHLLLASVI